MLKQITSKLDEVLYSWATAVNCADFKVNTSYMRCSRTVDKSHGN